MFRIYKNPEAKHWLVVTCLLSIGLGTLLFWINHVLVTDYQSQLNQQALHALAIDKTNGDMADLLTPQSISEPIAQEMARFKQLQWTPQTLNTSHHTQLLIGAWIIATLLLGCIVHLLLARFYKRIDDTTRFTEALLKDSAPIDIRNYEEGALSQLQNNLYHMATQLHQSAEKSAQHKRYLAQHIADISHQIKTPLTSLHVLTDQLRLMPMNKRDDSYIDLMTEQTDRIETLVQSLLLLSRLDANALALKQEHVDVKETISQLTQQLNVLAKHKDITFLVSKQGDMPIVTGDAFLISEAIGNVMKNAIDHANSHSTIFVSIDATIFYTAITVFNHGKNIPQEDLPYIFDRFYRGKYAKKTSVGIGLSIAYEIIDRHKGKITAENQKDGVLFTLHLPKNR